MATKLQEKREELAAKRKALAEIFEKYPNLDMPADVAADIKTRNDELTALGKEFEELKALASIQDETKAGMERDSGRSTDLPTNRQPDNGQQPAARQRKSIGQMFVESSAFKEYNPTQKRGPSVELNVGDMFERKALLDETAYPPQAVRIGVVVPGALRRPVVADLIPQGTTTQIAIVYMEETTTTNAADTVAEGAEKPESTLEFTEKSSSVRKIATVLPVTDELMADEPAMRSYVDNRLEVFLKLKEEDQLLSGDGIAPNIRGISNTIGIQTQAKGADPTPDAIYKAMTLIQVNSFLDPSGVVMHPLDWQDIRLLRTADGIYIWGSPADPGPERIWGLPVVKTTGQTQNTGLVGAFDTASQIFRRMEIAFAVSDSHSDFFIKNKLMIRAEERLALVVYRPAAFCKVTGI